MCSPAQGYYQSSPTPRLRALPDKAERLAKANEFINIIATNGGGKFIEHKGIVSHLYADNSGRIWLRDARTGHHIYTHHEGPWFAHKTKVRNRHLFISLRRYIQGMIKTGDDLFQHLEAHQANREIFPEADMAIVIAEARRLFSSADETHETQPETRP